MRIKKKREKWEEEEAAKEKGSNLPAAGESKTVGTAGGPGGRDAQTRSNQTETQGNKLFLHVNTPLSK